MANPVVVLETSKGTIKARLDEEKAPITVANFLNYVRSGHYDGTIFHRVIPNFMVQGGGMTEDMREKRGSNPIKNEAGNGLRNERGTLAMARTGVVDSATAQFFINLKNNEFLNHQDETSRGFGYAVFGEVIEGMDVVDKIVLTPTTTKGGHENVPREPITITSVRVEE
jgi:peptidyl-prolyl cis-trans isomerase A (cyclophilin A)